MLFRFNIGKSRQGGLGLNVVSVYYMPHWETVRAGKDRIVYRPTGRTLIHLLEISGLALFVLAAMTWFGGFPWTGESAASEQQQLRDQQNQAQIEDLRRRTEEMIARLPPHEAARIKREQAARHRELRESVERSRTQVGWLRAVGRAIHWLAFIALSAVAVLPIAGFPLQRVTLERQGDELVIQKRGWRPSRNRWPIDAFGQIVYAVEEETASHRYHRWTIGWRWMVKLVASPTVAFEQGPSIVDDPIVAFMIDYQKDRPDDVERPPRSVRRLIKQLRRLTGIRTVGRTEIESTEHSWLGRRRVRKTTSVGEPAVSRQVYDSLDEVPEHLRDQAQRLMRKARDGQPAREHSIRVTVRDSDGHERVYTSLEEMPPDLRRRYQRAMRRARRSESDQ